MISKRENVIHPITPTFDANSEVLILGSFPSVKSRESGYFYGHPQNRYWKVLAAVFGDEVPQTVEEKRAFLLRHHVAAWDVIASCTIEGSSDASIRDVVPNDLRPIIEGSRVRRIFVNGKTAERMFRRYTEPALAAWLAARAEEAAAGSCGAADVSGSCGAADAAGPCGAEDAERFTCLLPAVCLPSTSPANAAWSVGRLTEAWRAVTDC